MNRGKTIECSAVVDWRVAVKTGCDAFEGMVGRGLSVLGKKITVN